jgi:hypothetical protein
MFIMRLIMHRYLLLTQKTVVTNFAYNFKFPDKLMRSFQKRKILRMGTWSGSMAPWSVISFCVYQVNQIISFLWVYVVLDSRVEEICGPARKSIHSPGNTNSKGWLRTVDLLIKVACFAKKLNIVYIIKSSWSKLVVTWRSTVLSLPFP